MTPSPLPEPQENGATKPPIDLALLDSLAGSSGADGENRLGKMITLFTESGVQLLDQMDEALGRGDIRAAVSAVHKLIGGCGYFGAEILYSLCAQFERLGRSGDESAVRALAAPIRQEYSRVEAALLTRR